MIIRFSATNHRSIFGRQELSLAASKLKDAEGSLIPCDSAPDGHLLSAAVIYGANASGKSNIISALKFMESGVLLSHPRGKADGGVPVKPFALGPAETSSESTFDIDFVVDNIRYHYGFSANAEHFTAEWLYSFPFGRRQMLFERTSGKDIEFGRNLKGRNRVIADLMRPNSLFISTAIQNSHDELTKVASLFQNMIFNNAISVDGSDVTSRFKKNDVDERTINFLQATGTGVVGFRRVDKERTEQDIKIEKEIETFIGRLMPEHLAQGEPLNLLGGKRSIIELAHQGADGKFVYFEPKDESSGTRRLLVLVSTIFRALDEGAVIVVDELDASLHTQACEAVLALFSNKTTNPKGAQIIATTHDTNLMQSHQLRRDQIWFCEKDHIGATHLFPLSDIQLRKTDNIEKGYLQGRFGAIPFSGSVDSLLTRI